MSRTAEKAKHIASADGEVVVDAKSKTAEELLSLATIAGRTGGRTVVINVEDLEKELLLRVAFAGKGNVLFDLR